jgi:hypothetical protein
MKRKLRLTIEQRKAVIGFLMKKRQEKNPQWGDAVAVRLLDHCDYSFADLIKDQNIPLSQKQRNIIEEFLSHRPNRTVILCQKGFLDTVEGVPVDDSTAIRWVEKYDTKIWTLFE